MQEPQELTPEQGEELHADLLALRDKLAALLDGSKDRARAVDLDQPIGRLTRMDAMQQQKMAAEERRRWELRQQQTAAALKAFDNGDYGFCRRCEEPTGYPRLKARPETPFCVSCMGSLEKG